MNMDRVSLKSVRTLFSSLLALFFLTACTAYMGDHKVIVKDYNQPTMQPNVENSGFPDPVLRDNLFEARVDKLPSGIHICFPDFEEC